MKGIAEEYIFSIVVVVVVMLVGIGILMQLKIIDISNEDGNVVDVRYACAQFNNSAINKEGFDLAVYGFLTGQCDYLFATAEEAISFDEIRTAVSNVDGKIGVLPIGECKLPFTDTHTFYYCCKEGIEKDEKVELMRKTVRNSNVLLCIS